MSRSPVIVTLILTAKGAVAEAIIFDDIFGLIDAAGMVLQAARVIFSP